MTLEETLGALAKEIAYIQDLSGDEMAELKPSSVPIGGVPCFDSLRGLELSVRMDRYFDVPDGENICVSDDGRRALRMSEIAEKLMAMAHRVGGN